jgi:hypothetical protein
MTRLEIVNQARLRSLVESTTISNTEIQDIVNEGVQIVAAQYPYPVTIVTLTTDGQSPAWNAGYHWLLVSYALARIWEREEYFEQATVEFERFYSGMSDMALFYNGGRT